MVLLRALTTKPPTIKARGFIVFGLLVWLEPDNWSPFVWHPLWVVCAFGIRPTVAVFELRPVVEHVLHHVHRRGDVIGSALVVRADLQSAC